MKKSTMVVIGVFLLIFLAIGCSSTDSKTDTTANVSTETVASTSTQVAQPAADASVCNVDWKCVVTNNVGQYYIAPTGSSYVIVDLYLKNNDDRSISTNPYSWNFVADGITYNADVATFSEGINQQSVAVGKGGEMESQLVYLIKGNPTTAELKYNTFGGPTLQRVEYYTK